MFVYLPKKEKLLHLLLAGLLLFGLIQPVFLPSKAYAAATGYFRPDRMSTSTATGGSVCINPNANQTTVRRLEIVFAGNGTQGAASFGVNATGSNWTWDTTNIPSGTTAFPGTATTSTVSSATVNFIVTADQSLNTGTTYCLHFTGTSTLSTTTSANGSLTGTIILRNSSGTALTNETINYATAIISSDQIAVTATVPSTFTFALSGNTAALSTLSTSSVTSATGITATVNTNANNGWITWVKSTNGSLSSSSTSDSISSPGTTNATPESLAAQAGYVLDTDLTTDAASGGTVTVDAEFNGADTNSGGHLVTTFQPVASANGPAGGDVVTLLVRAKAGALNKAASDYADTLTVTAAGQF